jgi:hypothetical protein
LAAGGFVLLVVIAVIASGGKKSSGTRTTSGTSTGTATTSAAAPELKRRARRNRCARITRSAVTSCRFALAVKKTYLSHPSGTVVAYSPVTHKTYTMRCVQSKGVAVCTGGTNSEVAFMAPAGPGTSAPVASTSTPTQPPPAPTTTTTTTTTTQVVEQPGSSSHATDDQFCSTHQCIENFPNGNGSIVQCQDGEWSHSGGLSGACSDHGGEN